MKNIKTFIFLSNATGGIATYQSNIINFLAKKNHNTLLIDKKFNQTENNVKKKWHDCNECSQQDKRSIF